MVHVVSVRRSIAWYAQLGFAVRGDFTPRGAEEPSWAALESGGAQLMVSRASEPVVPEQQAVLFYLYFDDVPAIHARLTELGLEPGPITTPFYNPKGEFRLIDPDGYCLMITHT
jgi:hypothetical protein